MDSPRVYVFWPDGTYSICVRSGGEWLVRLPDRTHLGARRLLVLWRAVEPLGAVFSRIEARRR